MACGWCGRKFTPARPGWQKWHSPECRMEAYKQRQKDQIIAEYIAQHRPQ